MLRVANIGGEAALETVHDALDRLGVDHEHIRSESDEDHYPQTAYFYTPDGSADEIYKALRELSKEFGFDTEVL